MVQYQLTFSARRKTLGLQVKQGKVFVRAPNFLSEKQIDQFVQSKSVWLKSKIQQTSARNFDEFAFENAQSIFIHGTKRKFYWLKSDQDSVTLNEGELVIHLKTPSADLEQRIIQCRNLLDLWCTQYVKQRLADLLPVKSSQMSVNYQNTKIRRYKSRWGSCTNKGNLTFNSLLAMVPASVFEYVVVHELAHIEFLDHSASFWALVAKFHPNYQADKAWLKTHQRSLNF